MSLCVVSCLVFLLHYPEVMDIAAHSGLFRRCLMGRYCNIDCYRDQPRRWQAANVPLERMPAFTASKTLLCVASVLWAA